MKFVKNYLLDKKNNFLFFLMLSFVFISSTALNVTSMLSDQLFVQAEESSFEPSKEFPDLPVLKSDASYPVISAQGAIALDLDSGIALYEKNADAPLLPASTTKIITALVALDYYKPDSVLTVGREIFVDGQKMGLYLGEQISFEALIQGLLIYSANDAAMTLAHNYEGGYSAFIAAMNAKAKDVSMKNSYFDNPVGLDSSLQRSTAKDLVRASQVAMRNPVFANIVGTKDATVSDISGRITYKLSNLNKLLGTVQGVSGIKTGWTESARENLVTYITRDNHRIIIAILGSTDRFGETKELVDWMFSNYDWSRVIVN